MYTQIILRENVRNVGQFGQIVKVRAGYARNYLIPMGKAEPATASNLAAFEARRAEWEARAAQQLATAQSLAQAILDAGTLTLSAQASDEGKLYGSVGPREIALALSEAGFAVERQCVQMPEGALRQVGEAEVSVQLHPEVEIAVLIRVVPSAV